ncbi:MAG TPA: alpha/beta hydrolase-fold protein [Patescibacteria group bacterium]|nr:alpha/beta hydrolase-fold protein [Patescibacteria group bacterium]
MIPDNLDLEAQFISIIREKVAKKRVAKAEVFWHQLISTRSTPLIVSNRVYFLHYGEAERVEVAGDWSRWRPSGDLVRIPKTQLFFKMMEFPHIARLQYKLIVDGNWGMDTHNSQYSEEGFGLNSEFIMPGCCNESWVTMPEHVLKALPEVSSFKKGAIEKFMIQSEILKEEREIFLYTPTFKNGVDKQNLPLLVIHDGAEAISIGKFNDILDNMIAADELRPCLALFISPKMRNDEYALNENYMNFCVKEALGFAVKTWRKRGLDITADPHERCITGASLGGLLSTLTVFKNPDILGAAFIQSPAYWWQKREIFKKHYFKNADKLRVVLQTGTVWDTHQNTVMMYSLLKERGAEVFYEEFYQGHTWGNWRSNFASGLKSWLPKEKGIAKRKVDLIFDDEELILI